MTFNLYHYLNVKNIKLNIHNFEWPVRTQAMVEDFLESLIAKPKELGSPKMGLSILMGKSTKPKLLNLLGHLKSIALKLKSGFYKKELNLPTMQ